MPESMTSPAVATAGNRPPRVLLVWPKIPANTYWSYDSAMRMIGKRGLLPPLGLVTIAAQMPQEVQMRLVDENIEALTDTDIEWADAIFLSAMIVQRDRIDPITERVHAAGKPVVMGGPHISSAYANHPEIDHLVIGECEHILDRFWADFTAGVAKRAYARPHREAEVQRLRDHFGADCDVEASTDRPCLHEQPIPRFDLLDLDAYKSMAVQTSRGCPVGCEFCDIWRRFGRTPRYKPGERVVEEFQALYDLGCRGSIFVVDDNFIGNRKVTKELLTTLAAWQEAHNHPFDLYTEVTVTLADDAELLELMASSGFDTVFVGIETPAEESLKETRKHINTKRDMRERISTIQNAGIQVTSGFIIGFDNDPDDIAELMIDCIQDLGIPTAMVGLLQALPDTDLHERLTEEGRMIGVSDGNNTAGFRTNFVTRRSPDAVEADYKRVLQAIYPEDLAAFFDRCRVLRDRWPEKKATEAAPGLWEYKALTKYLLQMPLRKYRWEAARFLAETLVRKPSFFPTAAALAIQGHHFAEITRNAFEVERMEQFFHQRLEAFRLMLAAYAESFEQNHAMERIAEAWGQSVTSGHDALAMLRETGDEALAESAHRLDQLLQEARKGTGNGRAIAAEALHTLTRTRDHFLQDADGRLRLLSKDTRTAMEGRYETFRQEMLTVYHRIAQSGHRSGTTAG